MTTTVTSHERPGVYSRYDTSSVVRAGGGKRAALVAMAGGTWDGSKALLWFTYAQAATVLENAGEMAELVRLLFLNGAAAVYGVPVGETSQYQQGIATAEELEDVGVVVCDSADLSVQQALRESVERASQARRERIAVVGGGVGESVSQLTERAGELNSERVVLVAPGAADGTGTALSGARCAAAVAGAVAGQVDPAAPLGGAVLRGLTGLSARYGDNEIDALVRGGVSPLESAGGQVSVVRGITTRTMTGESADATWRELSTVLIVDDVIPGVREALRAKFPRAKNTRQGRSAIRAQVIVELEKRAAQEIIAGYEDVSVSAVEDDPTVCLVEFSFTVAHGLNQIWLSAHIAV